MKIYLVRHGQTDANAADIVQGSIDNPLGVVGQEQAQKIAARLATEEIAAVYASTLKRAIQTAEQIAAKHSVFVKTTSDLCETNFGIFEGRPWPELKAFRESIVGPFENAAHPDGESFQDQLIRAENILLQINAAHAPDSNVVVVTHGGFLRVLISKLTKIPLRESYERTLIKNCSLTIIENNSKNSGESKILLWNDTSHLTE